MTSLTSILPTAIVALFLSLNVTDAQADPYAVFAQHDDTNPTQIDYSIYETLFEKISTRDTGRTEIYYAAMDGQVVEVLNAYIAQLAQTRVSALSRQEQLAFWLNLKNLLVVATIAGERPGGSIEKLRGAATEPGSGWTRKVLRVEGTPLSIHDIEQEILLRFFASPDLIYGLYQGSKGGPEFPQTPFSGSKVEQQLRERGADFVNARRAVKIRSNEAQVPGIYGWYVDRLFDGNPSSLLAHLRELAEPRLRSRLDQTQDVSYQKHSYKIDEAVIRLAPSQGGGFDYDSGSSGGYQGGS